MFAITGTTAIDAGLLTCWNLERLMGMIRVNDKEFSAIIVALKLYEDRGDVEKHFLLLCCKLADVSSFSPSGIPQDVEQSSWPDDWHQSVG